MEDDRTVVEPRTAFILELLEKLRRSQGCPVMRDFLRVDDAPDQVSWDLVALVDHHVRKPNSPKPRQEPLQCRDGRLDSNLPVLLGKYAFYVRKDERCIVVSCCPNQQRPCETARKEKGKFWGTDIGRSSRRLRASGGCPHSLV